MLRDVKMLTGQHCRFYEFGVAEGKTAEWLSNRLDGPSFSYRGFDSFTGLPTSWVRGGVTYYQEHFFDNHGNVPQLKDDRFLFRKGLIENNLELLVDDLDFDGVKIFLFDFDLYSPSIFAWNVIKSSLQAGDYLYFDEAFDSSHERRLILEEIVPQKEEFEYIGNTNIALLLRKR